MYKTNITCYTKLQRCELAPDNFRESKQLFHDIYFRLQHFWSCIFTYCIFSRHGETSRQRQLETRKYNWIRNVYIDRDYRTVDAAREATSRVRPNESLNQSVNST